MPAQSVPIESREEATRTKEQANNTPIDVAGIANVLAERKQHNGGVRKMYGGKDADAKAAAIAAEVRIKTEALKQSSRRNPVNFDDVEDVQNRAFAYFEACEKSGK